MKIKHISITEIFDSRSNQTIAVSATTSEGTFNAYIPAGKSRGSREATVKPPRDAAVTLAELAVPALTDKPFTTVQSIDDILFKLDPSERKERLGGNLSLGISIAAARAIAAERKLPLWRLMREEFFSEISSSVVPPRIYSNFINGGEHAATNLALQEYLIVTPPAKNPVETIRTLITLYQKLGKSLASERNLARLTIGDEGGYALDFKDDSTPLAALSDLLDGECANEQWLLALDAAASSFETDRCYKIAGGARSADELSEWYLDLKRTNQRLFSIEDPFAEDDNEGFALLHRIAGPSLAVIGDDLTVTNAALIETAARNKLITGVIIKPNQIGTVSETCSAARTAATSGLTRIVSHRSGETEDAFIIHLARACNAEGVKIGAPVRERIYKFNELIRVYTLAAPQ